MTADLEKLVKPLVWEAWEHGTSWADSIFGRYSTWGGHWRGPTDYGGRASANPEADAQSDYARCVAAALDPDAVAKMVQEAVIAERERIMNPPPSPYACKRCGFALPCMSDTCEHPFTAEAIRARGEA